MERGRRPCGDISARPLLVAWDGLPAHRSRLVRDYLANLDGWIQVEYLPPYAPELNPVEYIWAYWKQHELLNVCPKDFWSLGQEARRTLGPHVPPSQAHHRFLEGGFAMARMTLYYAGVNKLEIDAMEAIYSSCDGRISETFMTKGALL